MPYVLMTTVRDNYFMFLKFNLRMPVSATSRDATAKAELQLRKLQRKGLERLRKGLHRAHQPYPEHPPHPGHHL
jgi:hypothetical protein